MGDFVSNPNDCTKFYYCLESGEGAIAECPRGMLFNKESNLCDQSSNVKCEMTGNNNGGNSNGNGVDPNENSEVATIERYCATQTLQQNGRIEYVSSSTSCRQYYICYYGQAILQECSANLHWNAQTRKCDFPATAGCKIGNNNPGQFLGNNPGNLINCPIFGEHVFPHMQRCNFFVYCVKGHAILQQCPFYYEFDVDTKTCRQRKIARCVTDLL